MVAFFMVNMPGITYYAAIMKKLTYWKMDGARV